MADNFCCIIYLNVSMGLERREVCNENKIIYRGGLFTNKDWAKAHPKFFR